MDTLLNAALEETCSNGDSGLHLSKLWPKLPSSISSKGFKVCLNVKKVFWFNLIDLPGLKFESNGVVYNSTDSCVRSFDQSEQLDLKIIAPEHMCDGFIGVYGIEASDAKLSENERRVLRYLATVRGKGIAQNEIGKDFKIKGNEMFYIVMKLEKRGLIVRQPTILRIRDVAGEGDFNTGPVSTNMLYLSRYAKNLGSQQRLEITKGVNSLENSEITDGEDENNVGVAGEFLDVDLCIKDFLPELEVVYDKLDNAEGKVLVMVDIKPELGYQGTRGNRRWRYILKKLKEDDVIIDGKEVKCLHLLKEFSPKHFETMMKKAKRGHISDLLLELPIEHQIYDMVEAEGDRGLPFNQTKTDEESATHNGENYKDVELQKEMHGSSDKGHKAHKVTILNLSKAVAEPSSEKQTINEAKGCRPTEASSPTRNHPEEPYDLRSTGLHLCKPILPWLNGDGTTNERVYKGIVRRVLGLVMQNSGIKEGDSICHMHVLHPQTCRSLLNMMVLDNDIFARKIPQTNPSGAPAILSSPLGNHLKKSKLVSTEHFFANPSSTHLL